MSVQLLVVILMFGYGFCFIELLPSLAVDICFYNPSWSIGLISEFERVIVLLVDFCLEEYVDQLE